ENAQAMCPTLILEIDGGGQVSGPRVTAFRLINAQNEQDLGGLSNEQVVDLAALGTSFLSVEAITDPAELEGSVVFELNGPVNRKQTENIFPYALFGDNSGDFNGANLLPGDYTLTATPFSGKKGTGEAGTPLSISFQITNSNALRYTLEQSSALYPNPSEGEVFLDLHLQGNEQAQVLIYDNQGQVVNDEVAKGNQQLSFQNMAPGLYMVRVIRENNKVEVLHLIIK
ncbi:MAG: T9SS type A sorting domain-containing protein, partial [Bacteroidota bacterium]